VQALFDEFCAWAGRTACPVDDDVRTTYTMAADGAPPHPRSAGEAARAERRRLAEAAKARRAVQLRDGDKYSKVERQFKSLAKDERKLALLWRKLDRSADGSVSVRELHHYMVRTSKHAAFRMHQC
jgi:hypothetical protein